MEIKIAKAAGFCMGVRRAVEMALDAAHSTGETVYTYGPLIHNPQELDRLRAEGIVPLGEDQPVPNATVIVRAHGVTPQTAEKLRREASLLIDATCPKVEKIHEKIVEYVKKGYRVVIAGDADHPEVAGLLGYAGEDALVVQSPEEIDSLPPMKKAVLVAQTTQDEENYKLIRERFLERYEEGEALSTICLATHKRQEDVRRLTSEVEGIIVIGGQNSANTRRLYEIAVSSGVKAWHIETARDLPFDELRGLKKIGLTAGASTPLWVIKEVREALENC
ncbi:4-hydroxy-3-methylbut-2-enyl diphosphate reductase [bacterium]|nr:MAG: 4-hydroxy-3-methylbut-2-enyl diphosphate reductase [bacterium]